MEDVFINACNLIDGSLEDLKSRNGEIARIDWARTLYEELVNIDVLLVRQYLFPN